MILAQRARCPAMRVTLQCAMPKPAVLVIDDEPDLCELLSITLQRMDLNPRTANTVAAAQTVAQGRAF